MQPNEATAGTELPSASARNARIGLVLVIVTAAIATALVLATILPGGPRADAQHADAAAAEVAASIRSTLGSATGIAGQLAADPAVVAILAKPGTKQPPAPPPALVDATSRIKASAPQVMLVDAARAVRLAYALPGGPQPVGNGAILVAARGITGVTPIVIDAQGDHRVGVVAPVPAGLGKGGSVLVSISLEAVVEAATAAAGPGAAVELLDAKGARIARADASPAPGGGTDPSQATVTATANRALDGLPAGFPAWSIVVRMPVATTTGTSEPLPILLGLAAILGVVGISGAYLALRPAGRLASTSDELQRKYAEVAEQAYIDVMTGLGNQRAFQIETDRHLDLVRRGRLPLTLVILDLDDFKRINDTDGHKIGDELLAAFARIIEGCIRRSDRAFRIGGDEFAILMPGTNVDGAEIVTRRLLASALEPPVGSAAGRRVISFSGGIAEATPQTDRVELFSQADAAMYWSKRHGRTSVSIFDPDKHPLPSRVSADLTAAIAKVIEQRSVRAVFQPIVELATGRVIGYEGLVRPTAHPFVDAGSLFAAAEGSGRTAELDYVCLETVAAAAVSIPADRYVAINLSPRTLEAPEFNALALCRRLARLGLPSQRIVLELTEREEIEDLARLRRGLEACRALGVRVAADDVGAGNAGLRLLSLVPFDVVKIDLSLVQDAVTHETSAEILATLRDLATRRGAVVVAEGLETQQQLKLVLAAGIDAGQGYLLGRPGEATDAQPIDMQALLSAQVRFGATFVEHVVR